MILDEFKKELSILVETEGYFDKELGEYVEGKIEEVKFKGALLPLSEKDLKYLEEGTYSLEDLKLYTDKEIKNNTVIKDDDKKYTVYGAREYGIINPIFKRYFLKRVDIDG